MWNVYVLEQLQKHWIHILVITTIQIIGAAVGLEFYWVALLLAVWGLEKLVWSGYTGKPKYRNGKSKT